MSIYKDRIDHILQIMIKWIIIEDQKQEVEIWIYANMYSDDNGINGFIHDYCEYMFKRIEMKYM